MLLLSFIHMLTHDLCPWKIIYSVWNSEISHELFHYTDAAIQRWEESLRGTQF